MSLNDARGCISGQQLLLEQFIPDHVFLYVTKGEVAGYDGSRSFLLRQGEYCLIRKNRLARYYSEKATDFERIIFCFEEAFLRGFQEKHGLPAPAAGFDATETFLTIAPNVLIPAFVHSLQPYTDTAGRLDPAFEDVKYEELLIILLRNQPALSGLLFDYAQPEKINLEEFMNRNYRFNVSVERFAYLTGRSLSAFKREFKEIFHETPSHWLIRRRLNEAYILIDKGGEKASEIYLELGFEDLSHFSFAFKKQFGLRPTELRKSGKSNIKGH